MNTKISAAIFVCCCSSPASRRQSLRRRRRRALTLKSVNVTLPDGDRDLPDGPGLAAVQSNCISCHTPGMILTQPAMPKAFWEAEVAKMRNVYKAPISDKDVPDIVAYLTAVKGPK